MGKIIASKIIWNESSKFVGKKVVYKGKEIGVIEDIPYLTRYGTLKYLVLKKKNGLKIMLSAKRFIYDDEKEVFILREKKKKEDILKELNSSLLRICDELDSIYGVLREISEDIRTL